MARGDDSLAGDVHASERVRTERHGWTLGSAGAQLEGMRHALDGPEQSAVHGPGQVIQGRYELLRRMAGGGMGEVWLAQHLTLDAEVAVKLTRPEVRAIESGDHLLHEARVLSRLNHPSIVRVLDFGVAESGFPFLVIELLRGPSLRQTLTKRGRLSARATVRLLLPVASALATVHAHGMVHRDLKPENVILVPESSGALTPKVFDFGIAECATAPGVLAEHGNLVGSPEYMSPEQVRGDTPVDARADVWAFCVLFYELVTGCSPFARGSLAETLAAVLRDPVPALPLTHGDLTLSAILARGLAKDRDRRWPSMQALGEHLAAWALREGVEEDATGTSVRTHWLHPVLRPLSDPSPAPAACAAPGTFSLVLRAAADPTEEPSRRRRSPWRGLLAVLAACLIAAAAASLVLAATPANPSSSTASRGR